MTKSPEITPEMIRLYDDYTHLSLDRRRLMRDLSLLAGSSAAAYAVLPVLENNYAQAAIIEPDDARITSERVTFAGASGEMKGYQARPAASTGKLATVLVIHENRGLNPHVEDVARRLAVDGFLALAVDFLSPSGGTPDDADKARDMIRALDRGQTIADAVAAVKHLQGLADGKFQVGGKVGAVGFCWGGGMVNQLAVHAPVLTAGVAYYGQVPAAEDVEKIKAKLLLHYAGLDERINAGIAEYRTALEVNDISHQIEIYEGVNHAFNNDTNAARYDKAAADLAWSRTVAFFRETLAG